MQPKIILHPQTQLVTLDDRSPTISVLWDRAAQQAVINAVVGPTVASRVYGMVHTAIFDAWAAYDEQAIATQLGDDLQQPKPEITKANKSEAMSYAAYRVLSELFPSEVEAFDQLMAELGYDPSNTTTDTSTAAGIGNVSAQALIEFRRGDGFNQLGDNPNGTLGVPYSDISGYKPLNSLDERVAIDRWTPERVPIDAEPGTEKRLQQFLTPHWGDVTPFALKSSDQFRPSAPEPFLLVDGSVDLEVGTVTLEDGEVVDIDASLVGTVINPAFIAQAEKLVEVSANLTDEQKLVAEFWEDGGGTSFPPGTWMTFGQFVSARDNHTLDKDAQLFFALGNAVFDAGIATWEAKVFYDYARPVRAIRDLGELGLIGEFDEDLGGYTIEAWQPGERTQRILATDFLPYQASGGDPSPPFSEYSSGHSAFSAAGAEVLSLFTGSDELGASVTFTLGESRFEPEITPVEEVTLEWETFSEAADEAGLSRIYGGIHFDDSNLNGRVLGRAVGETVFEQAQFYIQGGKVLDPVKEKIFGSREDDVFSATDSNDDFDGNNNVVFALAGDDVVDASQGVGSNRIFGNRGDDRLLAGKNDLLRGCSGDDTLDASTGNGNNTFHGGVGNDELLAGEGDRLRGGVGDDAFFVTNGGNNIFTGGRGNDIFWIAYGKLSTQSNVITDFDLGADTIGISGVPDLSSVDDLSFSQERNRTVISVSGQDIAILWGRQADNLAEGSFVFT